tara:strand:+ start:5981 stop:6604 length:624 start_codon:yes stop_codon:yes gene_type:complete
MAKQADRIKLSILILSIPSRLKVLLPLVEKLEKQIGDREDVEVLSLMDNKSYNVSEKRNELLRLARGSHLTWIDDDDDISDTYVSKLVETITDRPDADVISFDQQCYLDGKEAKVFAKIGNPHEEVELDLVTGHYKDTLRPPYHWCVWKSSLAKSEEFRFGVYKDNHHWGEDRDWLARLYPKVKTDVYLEGETLHIYRFSSELTESY